MSIFIRDDFLKREKHQYIMSPRVFSSDFHIFLHIFLIQYYFYQHFSEPRKPGAIIENLSNFSADGLHLKWEESDGFVNRYRVKIEDKEKETRDSKPEIYWKELLLPVTLYNVTITAISYGYTSNYYSFGERESAPATFWIMTAECRFTYKKMLLYALLRKLFFSQEKI